MRKNSGDPKTQSYYSIRWRDPREGQNNDWHTPGWVDRMSYSQAKKQLAEDIDYFYSYIELELVRVTEKVVSKHHGSSTP